MKLVAIVGTNSDRSTNRKLLQFMAKHFKDQADIEVLEIKDIPAFNEPEDRKAPAEMVTFSEKLVAADGVIIATPEYNHSIPAPLKSILEWISYTSRALINKPTMVVGASLGTLGSSRAQAHLRQILDAPELKARVMPGNEFLLGHSEQAFDASGQLVYEDKVAELDEDFTEFLTFVKMTNQLVAEHQLNTEQKRQFSWETAAE